MVFLIYRFVFESIESDLRGFKKIFFPLLKKRGVKVLFKRTDIQGIEPG